MAERVVESGLRRSVASTLLFEKPESADLRTKQCRDCLEQISEEVDTALEKARREPRREKLPTDRKAITHKFSINGHKGYITVGLYDDGRVGEIFLTMAKQGSTVSGLVDALATHVSIELQYGVPLWKVCEKFASMRFEPSGPTINREIPNCSSIVDYIARYLALRFLSPEDRKKAGLTNLGQITPVAVPPIQEEKERVKTFLNSQDAPACHNCGSIMVRNGSCYKCTECGETSGCS